MQYVLDVKSNDLYIGAINKENGCGGAAPLWTGTAEKHFTTM